VIAFGTQPARFSLDADNADPDADALAECVELFVFKPSGVSRF
jgi:hypothetical protein